MFNKLFSMLRIFFLSTALLAIIWLSLNGSAAHAASFTVTKLTDSNDGVCDTDCSLREAIIAA
ncbi:MAG: CSLREA domain-containing protein, partial [Anaerolineales bacterium]|nr:CSLREA domain-containing protein [Anaerolineales bacterium]